MNARTSGALALALIFLALPASAQQLWKWSTTPATNATADPAINWITGMAPSAVSPSARGMMAAVARDHFDLSGVLGVAGTSTAFTVTSASSLSATPPNGYRIAFAPSVANGAGVMLSVDGGTAYPIWTSSNGPPVPAATLVAGTPYTVTFGAVAGAWLLNGLYANPTAIPLGGIIDYAGSTAPNSNFALCYGQAISRTTYAALFAIIGTTYGTGDGVTTFNLPDLRGRMIAGQDNMGGVTASRITAAGSNWDATVLGSTGGFQNHTLTVGELPVHTPAGTISTFNPSSSINPFTPTGSVGINDPGHTHTVPHGNNDLGIQTGVGGPAGSGNGQTSNSNTTGITASFSGNPVTLAGSSITPTFSGTPIGSGSQHTIMPPTIVLTKLIRIF